MKANETSYVIKDLDQQTTYQFRVQTENSRGHSGWTYSYDLPDEAVLLLRNNGEEMSQSAQQILKQAAQSLKDMMALLRRTAKVDDVNASNEVLL